MRYEKIDRNVVTSYADAKYIERDNRYLALSDMSREVHFRDRNEDGSYTQVAFGEDVDDVLFKWDSTIVHGDWISVGNNGEHIMIGLRDVNDSYGEVRIFDRTETGEYVEAAVIEHDNGVTCGSFSIDGNRLVFGDSKGNIFLYQKESANQYNPVASYKFGRHVHSVRFSPDESSITAGALREQGGGGLFGVFNYRNFYIRDDEVAVKLDTGADVQISKLPDVMESVDVDAEKLGGRGDKSDSSWKRDVTVALLELPSATEKSKRDALIKIIRKHADANEDDMIVQGEEAGVLPEFAATLGKGMFKSERLTRGDGLDIVLDDIKIMQVSNDGETIMLSDNKSKVVVHKYDHATNSYKEFQVIEEEFSNHLEYAMEAYDLTALSPDGKTIIIVRDSDDPILYQMDEQTNTFVVRDVLDTAPEYCLGFAFSEDGNMLAIGGQESFCVYEKNPATQQFELVDEQPDHTGVERMWFSKNKNALVTQGCSLSNTRSLTAYHLNAETGKFGYPRHVSGRNERLGIAMSDDGKTIYAAGSADTDVYTFQGGHYDKSDKIRYANIPMSSISFTGDKKYMLVSGDAGGILFKFNETTEKYEQCKDYTGYEKAEMSPVDDRIILKMGNTLYIEERVKENDEYILSYSLGADPNRSWWSGCFLPKGDRVLAHDGLYVSVFLPKKIVKVGDNAYHLDTGEAVPSSEMPETFASLGIDYDDEDVIESDTLSEKAFSPRYANKPFYFAATNEGVVYVNFSGTWYRTRHTLLRKKPKLINGELASIKGDFEEVYPVSLEEIKHPYEEKERGLREKDFMLETDKLNNVERIVLKSFRFSLHVDLEGNSGAGKTSISRDIGLILGLPNHIMQMHGERELSDFIGSYREDDEGRIYLSCRPLTLEVKQIKDTISGRLIDHLEKTGILVPVDKTKEKYSWEMSIYSVDDLNKLLAEKCPDISSSDKQKVCSLIHYRQPLLEMMTHGGIFTLDEGAIGDKGRKLLSWISAILRGDKTIYLQEFPGREISFHVHDDFHLIITNNLPESTHAREFVASETASKLKFVYVDEDDEEETLKRLFKYFLGDTNIPDDKTERLCELISKFHWELKPIIGKEIGKDNIDRYYISKRELRRVAGLVSVYLKQDPEADVNYLFYKAMRIVYEAGYSHEHEQLRVRGMIDDYVSRMLCAEPGEIDTIRVKMNEEINEAFASGDTAHESWVTWVTDEIMERDEPILYITESGARSSEMIRYVIDARGSEVEVVDSAPGHTELEILGGLFPYFGKRDEGMKRSRFVKGKILKYLVKRKEYEDLLAHPETAGPERVIWIRNIDQWNEEIRTSLNGLLEDGHIDIETEEGKVERFYKPPHVKFIAEISTDVVQEFSSAFFNRWIKIGVIAEKTNAATTSDDGSSDFEQILKRYDLDFLEISYMNRLLEELMLYDDEKRWARRMVYNINPEIFYMVADRIRKSKERSRAFQDLKIEFAKQGYDPRILPFAEPESEEHKQLRRKYYSVVRSIMIQNIAGVLGVRFSPSEDSTNKSDINRFEDLLKAVFKIKSILGLDLRIQTEDETPYSQITRIGAVSLPISDATRAKGPLAMERADRLRYTAPILKGITALANAENLGRAALFIGESGAAKTSLAKHYSELTGKKFFKYQCHAGSEYTDISMDVNQRDSGNFEKRRRKLYRHLRGDLADEDVEGERIEGGNVVIDIDEANISPEILWLLDPLLRGEDTIYPIFPGEEPFKVKPGVVIVFTMNPKRYSGRKDIDRRLTDRMVTCWIDLPSEQQKGRII